MAFGVPEKIQQKQLSFSGSKTCTTSYHLTIQTSYLCRTENDNAVNIGAVPALREKHRIAQYVIFVVCIVLEYLGTIGTVAVDLCGTKALAVKYVTEFLRSFDKRQKYDCFSVGTVVYHFICNLIKVRIKSCVNIRCLEISRLC